MPAESRTSIDATSPLLCRHLGLKPPPGYRQLVQERKAGADDRQETDEVSESLGGGNAWGVFAEALFELGESIWSPGDETPVLASVSARQPTWRRSR